MYLHVELKKEDKKAGLKKKKGSCDLLLSERVKKKKKEEKKLPNNFKQNSHSVNKCFSYHLIRLRGCQSITGKTVNHILCPTQIY